MSNDIEIRKGVVSPVDCLKTGWSLIQPDLLLYVGMGLVVAVGSGIVPIVLQGPLTCGLFMCLAQSSRGGRPSFERLFKGFDKFVPCLIVALIQFGATFVVMVPLWVAFFGAFVLGAAGNDGEPSGLMFLPLMLGYGLMMILILAIQALFLFAYPVLADRDVDGVQAVKLSLAAVRANLTGVILLMLLNAVVVMVAWMLCCLPVLIALPLVHASYFAAYERIFGGGSVAATFE